MNPVNASSEFLEMTADSVEKSGADLALVILAFEAGGPTEDAMKAAWRCLGRLTQEVARLRYCAGQEELTKPSTPPSANLTKPATRARAK